MMNPRKTISLAYSLLQNAGDAFNKPLIESISGCTVTKSKVGTADMLALGGGLTNLQLASNPKRRLIQKTAGLLYSIRPLYIWGAGFLYGNSDEQFYRRNLVFCALRGELSRQKASFITGREIDVPLCDPGLLIGDVYPSSKKKQYALGIISHYVERDHPFFDELHKSCPDSVRIDIQKKPDEVFELISQCETIASSSLHGLVFADALGIPNMHIAVSGQIAGGNFKFRDYYSAFGLKDCPWDINNRDRLPEVSDIIDSYGISPDKIAHMKDALLNAFPEQLKCEQNT